MDDALEVALDPDTAAIEAGLDRGHDWIRAAGRGSLGAYDWGLVSPALARAILEALQDKWLDWLIAGWGKVREIAKYAKAEQVALDRTAFVKLGEHSQPIEVPIEVKVTAGGVELPAITFDAALTLDVAAVTLWIRNGYLVAVGGGECKARLGLSYDGHALIDEIELKTLKLPGKAMFRAPGIALPGREEPLIIEPVPPTAGG